MCLFRFGILSGLGGSLRGFVSGMMGTTMNMPNLGLFVGLWLGRLSSVCLGSGVVFSCVKVF